MTDVFVSYSRRNLDFVNKLVDVLTERGKTIWYDQIKEPLQGLPPASKWWDEIKYGIETADNFLFVISPESIASPYCNAEVAHALAHERRMVTVLYRGMNSEETTLQQIDAAIDSVPVDAELPANVSADITNLRSLTRRNWTQIGLIQYVPFGADGAFEPALDLLMQGLNLDLAWIRTWSQVRNAASLWEENDFDDDYLWGEARMKPIREMIAERQQGMSELEQHFLKPEWQRVAEWLHTRDLSHEERLQIGQRLAKLGDPRPGVGLVHEDITPLLDEREIRMWGDQPEHLGLPDIVWLPVKGTTGYTPQTDTNEIGTYNIADFYIAKYPITNIQFQAFADDDFDNPRWWAGLVADAHHRLAPYNPRWSVSNYPRASVSWYDAIAFCRWLNAKLGWPELPEELALKQRLFSDAQLLQDFYGIRLSTEWEWQWAASGEGQELDYPFGDWDSTLTNTHESDLSRTTTVGIYPAGSASCGALDMSGNVREWCINEHINPGVVSIKSGNDRVLRGGSWYYRHRSACTSCRYGDVPSSRDDDVGFRVVCRLPSQ